MTELLENYGTHRVPAPIEHEAPEASEEAPRKNARIDPDAPATAVELARLLERMAQRLTLK